MSDDKQEEEDNQIEQEGADRPESGPEFGTEDAQEALPSPQAEASSSARETEGNGAGAEAGDGEVAKESRLTDVADDLPVLPLRGIVVYPMMWLPLTIGQERSIKLVEDNLPQSRIIALVTSKDESIEEPSPDQIYEIGTAAQVHCVLKAPDGTVRLAVQGLERIRLGRALRGAHQSVDGLQRGIVVGLVLDRLDVHDCPLHPRHIDLVIFRMGSNEAHKDDPVFIVETCDQSIPVATDVEDHPVASDNACAAISGLDFRRRGPVGPRHDGMPRPERLFGSAVLFPKVSQSPFRDDAHGRAYASQTGISTGGATVGDTAHPSTSSVLTMPCVNLRRGRASRRDAGNSPYRCRRIPTIAP